jgi:hypothetical protein
MLTGLAASHRTPELLQVMFSLSPRLHRTLLAQPLSQLLLLKHGVPLLSLKLRLNFRL